MKKSPRVIIPIQPRSLAETKKMLRAAEKVGDVVEIWLDGIADLDISVFQSIIATARRPIIVHLKDAAERGSFRGGTTRRLGILGTIAAGAAASPTKRGHSALEYSLFVDIPLSLPLFQLKKFRAAHPRVGIILSWHDFAGMPSCSRLRQLAKKAQAAGADITKLVGTAKTMEDNYIILHMTRELAERQQHCLTMAMGETGQLTRVLTPLLGGWGMFAAQSKETVTASGQMMAKELRQLWQQMS